MSALYMRDPETAAILRRQAILAALNKPMDASAYRSAASPWAAGLQAIASAVNGYQGDSELRDLGASRRDESNQFMARALGGMGGMGGAQAAAAPAAPAAGAMPAAAPQAPAMPGPVGQEAIAPPDLAAIIQTEAERTGIPAAVLTAQIRQESNFNPGAVGRAGEIGLGQIMPATARAPGFGVAPVEPDALRDPAANVRFTADYLAGRGRAAGVTDWSDTAQQDRALAAYNGGGDPNYVQNVRRWMAPGGGASSGDAIPASAPAQGGAPAAPAAAPQAGGLDRQRLVAAALEGMNSQNPMVRENAQQLLRVAQALPQAPQRQFATAAPGSAILDPQTGRVIGQVPQAPDNTITVVPDPSSPSGFRNVRRSEAVGQPAVPPGPQVAIDQRGQTAYDQHRGTALATEEADIRASGPRSRQTLARLGTIEQNLERFRSGAMAGTQMRVGQIANALGVPVSLLERMGMSPDAVAAGEQIGSVSAQMLQGMLGPGGFPAQNFSNADREMLERALPGLANTPQGNRLIIGVMRAQAQRQVDISEAWGQWRRQNGSGMESYDRFTMERLPQITGQDVLAPLLQDAFPVNETPAAAPGVQADPPARAAAPGGRAPVRVTSPTDARRLPPGTPIQLPDGSIGRVPGG